MSSLRTKYIKDHSRHGVHESYYEADIYVWWDMISCPWPKKKDLTSIQSNIKLALENMNYSGTVTIFTYSNCNTITPDVLDILRSQQIVVREVEEGEDLTRVMGLDIIFWKRANPHKANFMAITNKLILYYAGNFDNVNVLIAAQKHRLRGHFLRQASHVWKWSSMAKGGEPLLKTQIKL